MFLGGLESAGQEHPTNTMRLEGVAPRDFVEEDAVGITLAYRKKDISLCVLVQRF